MTDMPPIQNPEAIPALLKASQRLAAALSDSIACRIDPKLRHGWDEPDAAWDTEILADYANAYAAVYGRLWWPEQQSVSALFAMHRRMYSEGVNPDGVRRSAQEAWDNARKEVPA